MGGLIISPDRTAYSRYKNLIISECVGRRSYAFGEGEVSNGINSAMWVTLAVFYVYMRGGSFGQGPFTFQSVD